jgi:hypothetical protein
MKKYDEFILFRAVAEIYRSAGIAREIKKRLTSTALLMFLRWSAPVVVTLTSPSA